MRFRFVLPLLLVSIGIGLAALAVALPNAGEAANLPHRRFVPGLAADSARAPTAVPTAFPAPIFDSDRKIALFIEIDAKELAVSGSGTTPVHISANAVADLPSVLNSVVTVSGIFTIAPHPPDAAGCTWTRYFKTDVFKVTFFYTGDLSILASMDAPEWYYIVQCGGGPPIRFPAFGEEGLSLFLRDVMAPYRAGNNVRVPTDVVSAVPISCVKRYKKLQNSSFEADATVEIFVYQPDFPGGCLLPVGP